jgi:eukaryotic-like serine/threonine-protein kinase
LISLRPGCVIVGKYRLEHELACGGMGSLWVAFDRKLRRQVAVKFINSIAARHDDARARFEHEARAMAHIRSPHVVQTHDYGVDRGHAYMVMELLDGEDLGVRLSRERVLPVTTVARLLGQIGRGLDAVHAAGIVHRDLKPANIFLAQVAGEETVKLIDFGVARSENSDGRRTTDRNVLVGTLKYMAPEQALCEDVDHRADLWSLAVIAYCLLTGKGPFSGSSREEMVLSICRDPVPAPSRRVPDLPPGIDAFFERAFQRAPRDRFHSAGQMASAFAAAINAARTGTLPWGARAPRKTMPSLPNTVAEGVSPEPQVASFSSRDSTALTELQDTGLPIPSAILPSTYTPTRRRTSKASPWARTVAPKKSWWWASIPVAVIVVSAVVLGIVGSSGTAKAGSAASSGSVMEMAPALAKSR